MAWVNPVPPVTNTVITVAYATSNIINPLQWLRLMTGNADPPGSNYVVTSDSVGATSWKTGLAAIQAVLGYTPVNKAGDTMGDLALSRAAAPTTGALFFGNTGGVYIFDNGTEIQVVGLPVHLLQALTVDGTISGGNTSAGALSALGLNAGSNGVANAGPYAGGSKTIGTAKMAVRGLSVGSFGIDSDAVIVANAGISVPVIQGIATAGQIASTLAAGTPPISVASNTPCPNLCAAALADQGGTTRFATSSPAGNAIPVADATGKLAPGWLPTAAQAVPTHAIVGFNDIATNIPTGWARCDGTAGHPNMNGRLLVGDTAGVAMFGQTFQVGGSYNNAWTHAHPTTWASHGHGSTGLTVSGTVATATGGAIRVQVSGTGTDPFASPDGHGHGIGTLDVGGTTDGAGGGGSSTDTFVPPVFGVIWIEKT